ncbi:MAG: tetratricopeptide repeat protein [Opitutae bacterium]|nr:tetratricopeptide repeat protein [Opitutae bacterium]
MKLVTISLLSAVCLLFAACKDKSKAAPGQPKEVSKLVSAEAENCVSDATFAVQIKDFARAEKSMARAVELRPDVADWWVTLGSLCKRQGKTSEARSAYKKALGLLEDRYAATSEPQDLQQQLAIMVLLGREADARTELERAYKKRPTEPVLKNYYETKLIDLLLQDENIKQMKL